MQDQHSPDIRAGQNSGFSSTGGPGTPILNLPSIVSWLLGGMALVFALQVFAPQALAITIDSWLGFSPRRFGLGLAESGPFVPVLFPLIGHVFVHGGLTHIALNSLSLAIFGTGVARRMNTDSPITGVRIRNTLAFLGFFFTSGCAGALVFYVMQPQDPGVLVGASGAISGLIGGVMRFVTQRAMPWGPAAGGLSPLHARPVAIVTALFIGSNLMTALGLDGSGQMNIAWEAHIGGYLCGLVTFPFFDRFVRR